ncbi:MAG: hypothetical protein JO277_07850 [Candidatus Eremiobacteraeota bacterium]|nr:hypothetical protein [Candidatus Eremiobacteraeota bacterium]
MAEVYTISGAANSANPFMPTPIARQTGAASGSVPAPVLLQNALKALGTLAGDPKLTAVAVDGVIGAKTVAAVNYALATYVGSTAAFPRADLTLVKVRQNAGALAQLITNQVQSRGGAIPTPQVQKAHRAPALRIPVQPIVAPEAQSLRSVSWVWWGVAGVSVLLALSVIASVVRGSGGKKRARKGA